MPRQRLQVAGRVQMVKGKPLLVFALGIWRFFVTGKPLY
jgi:hypothetical protein